MFYSFGLFLSQRKEKKKYEQQMKEKNLNKQTEELKEINRAGLTVNHPCRNKNKQTKIKGII